MADFITDDDVKDIATQLIEKFDFLSHVDGTRLLYVREISKSQKGQLGACRPVKPPYNLLDPNIMYIVVVYFKAKWDDLTDAQKQLLVMHQLLHISPEFDGNTIPHDASDWSFILDTFGTNYMDNTTVKELLDPSVEEIKDEDN
jgi:predicted metallopeptidase